MSDRLRRRLSAAGVILAVTALAAASQTIAAGDGQGRQAERTYVVLYEQGADASAARAAIDAAGGTVVDENAAIGLATVRSARPDFAETVRGRRGVRGAALERAIGQAPKERPKRDAIERDRAPRHAPGGLRHRGARAADPLSDRQWDMDMIDADPEGSYRVEQGDKKVLVGIMDTGIDASHPDIAPNFDRRLSRNFTEDDPLIDGPCSEDPDGSCTDPADVDEDGHGTHVAGTVGSPLNGLGMAGVAPRTTLVNLRAGQDSGYFFLAPTVDALTYAGDNGIDVVNMSFYIDPWLYNCTANPADTPEQQAEQRTIIEATQRGLRYARSKGVTLVGALGNQWTDLGRPSTDDSSPDYPPDTAHPRTIDNETCLSLPAEGEGVIGVTAVGPSGRKSYYSNYGVEQADVAAPGGDTRDHADPSVPKYENAILAPYPEALARANGELEPDGTPNTPAVVRDCRGNRCAYYQYLQGTSMASPHAAGVAALIAARYGRKERGGMTFDPAANERIMKATATDTPCPQPRTFVYPGLPAAYTATCEGPAENNGFYGEGIVNARRAVTAP